MTPTVSVIMAVRDGGGYLEAAVRSVLQQRMDELELIVINDGSQDTTAQILERLRIEDGRVRVVHQEPRGLTASLNRAAVVAQGRYLARQDADDLSKPGRLARQLRYLEERPAVAAVGTAAEMIDADGRLIGRHATCHGVGRVRRGVRSLRSTPVHGSAMIRQEAFEAVGGYRDAFRMAQDVDLWLRLLDRWELDNVPETLYSWRLNPRGIFSTQRRLQLQYAGIAVAFARERRRWGSDSCALLAQADGDLDAFCRGYRLRGFLQGLWGELLLRGLKSPRAARPYLQRAVLDGDVRPKTFGLLLASQVSGLFTKSTRRWPKSLPRRGRASPHRPARPSVARGARGFRSLVPSGLRTRDTMPARGNQRAARARPRPQGASSATELPVRMLTPLTSHLSLGLSLEIGAKLGVLMVTGAYDPEISGGGVQCRELVRALRERIDFSVLTTATDPSLPASAAIDGIPVTRIFVDAASPWSKLLAGVRMVAAFWRLRGRFEVLHFHGFSQKTGFLAAWGLLFGKRLLLTLHTGGHDEPLVIRSRDPVGFWWYRRMHAFSAVSPRLHERYLAGGLLPSRCRMILNGIDTARFHPVEAQERCAIRQQLGLPQHELIVLFVGVFSPEKRPDVLFGAWARLPAELLARSRLVFVGATRSAYHEVDATLSERIREAARAQGLEERVSFTGPTQQVERYYQASDVYVLSSSREGLPLALLEAMASGLACVSSQLEGVTDVVVEDDRSGLLVPACDERALAQALHRVAGDGELRRRLGAQARQTVERRFSIRVAAERYLELYRALADGTDALGAALAREPKPTGDGSLILAQASNDESH